MATNDDTKIYPGNLDRYRSLRSLRERLEGESLEEPGPEQLHSLLAAAIAEELAGLSYILDGIRYSARRQS